MSNLLNEHIIYYATISCWRRAGSPCHTTRSGVSCCAKGGPSKKTAFASEQHRPDGGEMVEAGARDWQRGAGQVWRVSHLHSRAASLFPPDAARSGSASDIAQTEGHA